MLGWVRRWFNQRSEKQREEVETVERSKFSALLTGVMNAVQKAASSAGAQNLHILDHYFKEDPDTEELIPVYTRIRVAPNQVMDVPLICLLEPSGYRLDELEMDLSVRLTLDQIKEQVHRNANNKIKRGSYSVELCPKGSCSNSRSSDVVDVRVKFKSTEAAEGLSRIIEDLNNTITPMAPENAPERDTLTIRLNKREASNAADTDDLPDFEPLPHEPDTDHQIGLTQLDIVDDDTETKVILEDDDEDQAADTEA